MAAGFAGIGGVLFSLALPCLRCSSGLHRDPHSATISTVSYGHVGKIVGKEGGRLTFRS